MKDLFAEILSIEDVEGVMLFLHDGQLAYQKFFPSKLVDTENIDWLSFGKAVNGIMEADLIFENKRIYLRKTATGYLMILMGTSAPAALVRLNIDLILPAIKDASPSGSVWRFLKQKK